LFNSIHYCASIDWIDFDQVIAIGKGRLLFDVEEVVEHAGVLLALDRFDLLVFKVNVVYHVLLRLVVAFISYQIIVLLICLGLTYNGLYIERVLLEHSLRVDLPQRYL
jgi:hypothetical protein